MRLTLLRAIILIVLYEVALLVAVTQSLMRRAEETAATRVNFLETVPMPWWWWPLALIPPALLITWVLLRKR